MPLRDIGTLTAYQVQQILFRDRDKHGQIRRDPGKVVHQSPEEAYKERWRRWGLSEARLEQKWQEELAALPKDEEGNPVSMVM